MGVLNVTPDSFSDGGRHGDTEDAVRHALLMLEQGAEIIDIGGESTRPGARDVPADVELERVIPVLAALRPRTDATLSVDTRKSSVAAAALEAGADWINDVSAGTHDPALLETVAAARCTFVAMHARGEPAHMQDRPHYEDPVREVVEELSARVEACLKAGIEPSRLVLDPGIGFGKRLEDNLALIRGLPRLKTMGYPILVGVSRKSFIGTLTSVAEPADRLGGTAAAVAACVLGGADVLRVHDVAAMAQVVRVATAIVQVP